MRSRIGIQKLLRDAFGVECSSLEDLEAGSPNRSFLLSTDAGRMVLKHIVCAPTDPWLRFQGEITQRLQANGVDLPELVRARDGLGWVRCDDGVYQVRRFVEGRQFELGNSEDLQEAALLLGLVHQVEADERPPEPADHDIDTWLMSPTRTLEDTLIEVASAAEADQALRLRSLYTKVLEEASAQLTLTDYRALPKRVSHGEFHGNNILFSKGSLVSLLDWDAVAVRPRVYDVARAGLFLTRKERGKFEVDVDALVCFLGTYLAGRRLLQEEARAIVPILQLYFLPSPRYLRLIREFKPEMMAWYLDWAGCGAETVGNVMRSALRRAVELGLVERPSQIHADRSSRRAVFRWHRHGIGVAVVCTQRESSLIATKLAPYIQQTQLEASDWEIHTAPPSATEVGLELIRSHPPGEPPTELMLDRKRKRIYISRPDSDVWRIQNAVRLIRLLIRFRLMEIGEVMLHAGMVRYGRIGIAFAGPKRAGKTSSILAAITGGATSYVSNDDLSIRKVGVTWFGFGWPRSVSARRDSVRAVLAQRGWRTGLVEALTHPAERTAESMLSKSAEAHGLHFIYPSEMNSHFGCGVAPMGAVDAIVLPTFVHEPMFGFKPELNRVDCGEAFRALFPELQMHAGKYDDFLAGHFNLRSRDECESTLGIMLREVPCYRLTQTMDTLCQAETLVNALAQSLRRVAISDGDLSNPYGRGSE